MKIGTVVEWPSMTGMRQGIVYKIKGDEALVKQNARFMSWHKLSTLMEVVKQ